MENHRIIVVKVGTSSLTDTSGRLSQEKLTRVTDQISKLVKDGCRPVLVTSAAIAAGFERLGFRKRPTAVADKQASASVGQGLLMEQYAERLMKDGIPCGQLLLTKDDFTSRQRYNNAFTAMQVLLSRGAVPIINENDAVAVDEIKIGDNDTLSGQVASMLHADLLVILTDIDGLYTANPRTDPDAKHIERVEKIDAELMKLAGSAGSANGTGGMVTKLRGAAIAAAAGVPTVICSYLEEDAILKAAEDTVKGTRFDASPLSMQSRKQWMAFYAESAGNLYVDEGAAEALERHGSSLLSAGITACEGDFAKGDVVNVYTRGSHKLLGRGLVRCAKQDIRKALANGSSIEVIHRNDWADLSAFSTWEKKE